MPFDLGWQPKGRWGCMVSLGQVLGMAFLVQRCVSDPLPVGRTIEVKDKLRVEIFADKSLEEVEQEMAFFRNRNQRHFVASNSDDCPKNPGEAAVQWLMTKLLSQPPAHFHHYACHCSTDSVEPMEHYLDFALAESQDRVRLSLEDLMDAQGKDLISHGIRPPNTTVTFLNACGSAVIHPFSQIFLCRLLFGEDEARRLHRR